MHLPCHPWQDVRDRFLRIKLAKVWAAKNGLTTPGGGGGGAGSKSAVGSIASTPSGDTAAASSPWRNGASPKAFAGTGSSGTNLLAGAGAGASPGVIIDRFGIEDSRAEVSHLAVDGHPVDITETAAAAPPTAPAAAAAQSFDYRAWRKRLLHARFEKLRAELMDEEYHRIATEVCVPVCPFVPLLPPLPLPLTLTLTR